MKTRSRVQVAILLLTQALSLGAIALATIPSAFHFHALDLLIYHDSSLAVLQGEWPYRESPMVYPPLALVPFALPHLLAGAVGFSLDLEAYGRLWPMVNILLSTGIALMLVKAAAISDPPRSAWTVLYLYTVSVIISGPILLWYYDLFPALLTFGALLAVLADRPALAGLCLGSGIAAKLYPAVLLPVLILFYQAGKQGKKILPLLLTTSAAAVIPFLPFAVFRQQGLASFWGYHFRRGLEMESLYAGLIALLHHWGLVSARPVLQYGTWDLVSPLSDAALQVQPFLFLIAYGGTLWVCWRRFRQERQTDALVACLLVSLLVFIITNKVFSPQYVLWFLPFGAFLRWKSLSLFLFLLILILTVAGFPFMFDHLTTMALIPILVVNLRNALMVILGWRLMVGG
ncbi:MAG: glycosyltransferase 87 family protein [Anaerolineae bacterium]